MLFATSIILIGCDDEGSSTQKTTNSTTKSTTKKDNEDDGANINSSLGNYLVEIKSFRIAEDYEGNPIVIVKYGFTNNDEDAAAFYLTFDDKVYQDGVSLNECYFLDDSANYSTDNQTKEIKKGYSIDVEIAYTLNDTSSDIEVEVSELISFSEKKITKVFELNS